MSGSGFHKFFAAMVLQSVDALSDDEATDKPTGSSSSVAAAKNAQAQGNVQGVEQDQDSPKSKAQSKTKGRQVTCQPRSFKNRCWRGGTRSGRDPMKKPAGKPVARKRPAAATTAGQSGPKKLKVYTYKYKDTDTFGYKVDGKQVLTVTRHMFMAVYGMPLSRLISQCFHLDNSMASI